MADTSKDVTLKNYFAGRVSKQAVADFVVARMKEQRKASALFDDHGIVEKCLYRSPDGCKCAIGHLIPDSQYRKGMDVGDSNAGQAVGPMVLDFYPAYYTDDSTLYFLKDLQMAHDYAAGEVGDKFVSAFIESMKKVYHNYKLDKTALTK